MNALANSQQEELRKYLANSPAGTSVTFGRYTGQESEEDRTAIMKNPPDILLTNFMMLELILTRYEEIDRQVVMQMAGEYGLEVMLGPRSDIGHDVAHRRPDRALAQLEAWRKRPPSRGGPNWLRSPGRVSSS